MVKSWDGAIIPDYKISHMRGRQKGQRVKDREAGRL